MLMRSQRGFTLLETTIVVAIGATMAILAIGFFNLLRSQAQFSDTMERLEVAMNAQRQEALSTIKLSGGTDATNVTIGRLLIFTPGSSVVQVHSLYTANNAAPAASQPVYVRSSENTRFEIQWSGKYGGATTAMVAFVRSPADGKLVTSVSLTGWGTAPYSYGDLSAGGAAQDLRINASGMVGYMRVNPANNSVVARYQ